MWESLFWRTSANGCFWKYVHETEKNWTLFIRSFNFTLKNRLFSTPILDASSWLLFHDRFPMKFLFRYNISLVWWEINAKQKNIKSSRKEYVRWTCFKFWPMKKIFSKTIHQWEFDYGLFTNLLLIIVARNFSPSSFKLKRGRIPLLTKYVS